LPATTLAIQKQQTKTKPHYEHNENKNTAEWCRQRLG
jgi:hypothetical protein